MLVQSRPPLPLYYWHGIGIGIVIGIVIGIGIGIGIAEPWMELLCTMVYR